MEPLCAAVQDYEKVYLFPNSHAGNYPGASPVILKLLFRKSDGRVLGAQALSEDGAAADKRISTLAMAIQMGATIYDLEEAEICYAPQFGSAKDAINFAGMIAAGVTRGDMPLNIPLGQLRARLGELPRDRDILVTCRTGQRSYTATRILLQNGFRARNLSGGVLSRAARSLGPEPRE